MTAPDPRVGEIEAWLADCRPCKSDCCGSTECQTERDAIYLLAELRKAHEALEAAHAEDKRDAAAAGLRSVCDVWGAGGRATVRLSELSEIAKDITEGEWDQHIEWNLRDIDRERTRAQLRAAVAAANGREHD